MSITTVSASTRVATDSPARVLARLCRHFAHKTPVEFDAAQGRIEFRSGGYATLQVAAQSLDIQVTASDEATLEQLCPVIERHLRMVEFRAAMPQLQWLRAAA
jgi:hypothetical protein